MNDTKAVTITRHIKVDLTQPEKNEKHEALVRTINDVKRLVSSFELIKEQHKANLKARQKDIDELSAPEGLSACDRGGAVGPRWAATRDRQ